MSPLYMHIQGGACEIVPMKNHDGMFRIYQPIIYVYKQCNETLADIPLKVKNTPACWQKMLTTHKKSDVRVSWPKFCQQPIKLRVMLDGPTETNATDIRDPI